MQPSSAPTDPLDDDRLVDVIAEFLVRSEEAEVQATIRAQDAYARGRCAGLAERPHRPERHEAETRRKLSDLAIAREVAKLADDPDPHPLRAARLSQTPPLSQRDLAALVGISRRAVLAIEAGGRAQGRTVASIAGVLGCASRDLGIELRR